MPKMLNVAREASKAPWGSRCGKSAGVWSGIVTPLVTLLVVMALACGGPAKPALDVKPAGSDAGANDAALSLAATPAQWSDEASPFPVSSADPMWGERDAPVTIVEYSDFQCPFCARVEPALAQLQSHFGPKTIRIIWKNGPLPFHPNARPAAEAAMGVFAMAGADSFWKFHDLVFKNQRELSAENYEIWAREAGVTDIVAWKGRLLAHTWEKKVEDDLTAMHNADLRGTPSFLINGTPLVGAQPFEAFKSLIDAELVKANAKLENGTRKDAVYVVMSAENKRNAPVAAKDDDDEPKEDTETVFKIPTGTSPVLGKNDALVTLIVFSDFQCPYCSRIEATFATLRAKYGEKVRFVWKNEPLPFHNRALPAAEFALEARAQKGDTGFWAAHDKLFENQKDLSDEVMDAIAAELHLDVTKLHAAISKEKYKSQIRADIDLGDRFGVQGTPHVFINGRHLSGAQPAEAFTRIIDQEVARAEVLLSKGTAKARIYEALIKDGKPGDDPALPEKKSLGPSPKGDPSRGGPAAKVVIHEFADFECPFCGRVEPTLAEITKRYGNKVRIVWHDYPLPMHVHAEPAAEAAREALAQKGLAGFFQMHDTLFAHQRGLDRDALDGYARDQGLNMEQWKAALDSHKYKADIDADTKLADDAHISGTPAFVINGYFVSGAQPVENFVKVIDLALAEAK